MTKKDLIQFSALWSSVLENYGSAPSDTAVQIAFQALAQFSLSEIQAALMNHIQTSEYRPTVKDVFAYCSNQASRFQVSGLNVFETERFGTVWGSPIATVSNVQLIENNAAA
jgi:Tfp pilus assembly ATPase PilU